MSANNVNTSLWELDSGATQHIARDLDIFSKVQPLDKDVFITFGNGERAKAEGSGNVRLWNVCGGDSGDILLTDVLCVPSAAANLLSIPRAVSRGITFTFASGACTITKGSQLLATAPCTAGLYQLASDKSPLPVQTLLAADAQLWHRRFGHLGYGNLARLRREGMVHGLNPSPQQFKLASAGVCAPCAAAKQIRSSRHSSSSDSTAPLQLLHMDVCGPFPERSLRGSKYLCNIIDDFSKLSIVQPIASKAEVAAVIINTILMLETQTGQQTKAIRSDNGSELVNQKLSAFLASKGILHQRSVRYTPEQNGSAERLNRTLMERVRAMLEDAQLPPRLWAEAAVTASYLRNRSPVSTRQQTPWELLNGRQPDVTRLRVFGARAHVLLPKQLRGKLDSRSVSGRLVGYEPNCKGYRIYLSSGKIIVSDDVIFDESNVYPEPNAAIPTSSPMAATLPDSTSEADLSCQNGGELATSSAVPSHAAPAEQDSAPSATPSGSALETSCSDPACQDAAQPSAAPSAELSAPNARRRSQREHVTPDWWKTGRRAMLAAVEEPAELSAALASAHAAEWQQAMEEELASLQAHGTWSLQQTPAGVKPIPLKWVFKVKTDAAGLTQRFKARLVAKGFHQREGVDFDEVYAPVSKYATLRALLALVAARDLELHQLDIKTAFLNGHLEEEVWVQQPPGFPMAASSHSCRLHRALYGLKQSPRAWHKRLSDELAVLGYIPSQADPGLFVQRNKQSSTFVLIYVDDILIAADSIASVDAFKAALASAFQTHDLGEAETFLNMSIVRDRSSKTLKLSQPKLTAQLLVSHNLSECNPQSLPLSPAAVLVEATEADAISNPRYGQLVGSLLHLAVCTRPDIAHAVGVLSRYISAPAKSHWEAAKGVLRYIAGTSSCGITFGSSSTAMIGHTDADYAGDRTTRRSTSGFVFTMYGGAVTWSSKRQATVATSTTEAEYIAAAAAVKEALWLRHLLEDLDEASDTIHIYADNQSALKLLRNPMATQRAKHIDVVYHFARERVARKEVEFSYLPTTEMAADMFTKAVPKAKLLICCAEIGVG